ncbi:MAG: tetratricopeptide repeat protein [bacterium]
MSEASGSLGAILDSAHALVESGRDREALAVLDAARDQLANPSERALVLGQMAAIRAARGDVAGALADHEAEIRIYDELGDRHARAITLVAVARLGAAGGDLDGAFALLAETLPTFRELGDADGTANTLWALAKVEIALERYQEAFDHLSDSYRINQKLDRLDGITFVGVDLGQLLHAAGELDEALAVLTRSRDGFVRLGHPDLAQKTQDVIDELFGAPGR